MRRPGNYKNARPVIAAVTDYESLYDATGCTLPAASAPAAAAAAAPVYSAPETAPAATVAASGNKIKGQPY